MKAELGRTLDQMVMSHPLEARGSQGATPPPEVQTVIHEANATMGNNPTSKAFAQANNPGIDTAPSVQQPDMGPSVEMEQNFDSLSL